MSGNYDRYKPLHQVHQGPVGYPNQPPLPYGQPPPTYETPNYLPPPPPEMPPMHHFGGDFWRPSDEGNVIQATNEFSFRANGSAPRLPEYRGRGQIQQQSNSQTARPRNQGRGGHRGRGRPPKIPTYNRPLLTFKRGDTPEQLAGMNGEHTENKFIDVGSVSDSDDHSMDESEPEEYEPTTETDNSRSPALKRQKFSPATSRKAQEHTVPKWSNPDPYTVLPPVEDAERKKRDVVKLIRKARVAAESDKIHPTQAASGDDFISFGFDEKDSEDEGYDNDNLGEGMPGAPIGPRGSNDPPTAGHISNRSDAVFGAAQVLTNGSNILRSMPDLPPLSYVSPAITTKTIIDVSASVADKLVIGGKRKRLEEDPRSLIAPKNKKGRGEFSGGIVLPEWANIKGANPLPWVRNSHSMTVNTGFRLHKEICDFYDFVKPRQFEQQMRMSLLERLQMFISNWNPDCTVHSFGSFAAGLYLPNADMDVVVVSKRFMQQGIPTVAQSSKSMHSLGGRLEQAKLALPGSVEVITKAKVPLVKYIDHVTRLRVDMSFENATGITANETFNAWKSQYPAMPILATVIKQFLLMRGLNNVATGGLGGFSVTCLVTSLLQNMPRLQLEEFAPEDHLGEVLLEFLDLWGNQFDIDRAGISMDPPCFFDKRNIGGPAKSGRLCILDPNKRGNDISGGSRQIYLILSRFSKARNQILVAMQIDSIKRKSLLDWLLGGNYNDFLWQRWHLRQLYEKAHGPIEPDYELQGHG